MPLSRHFYSLDEVQAALLYTTSRNNATEALFWCQELLLSGLVSETISTLFQSWLWTTGPMRLQWLVDAWKTLSVDELSEDDILLKTYNLSCIHHTRRDNSLWNILVLTAQEPEKMPDSITRKTPHVLPSDDEKELYLVRAIYQGKARSAWWISQFIQTDRVWELLEWCNEHIHTCYKDKYRVCLEALKGYEKLLGYRSDEYDIVIRCMAVLMMCVHSHQLDISFSELHKEIDPLNIQNLNEWAESVGRRDRRIYSIPSACLYGTTLRGITAWSKSNLTQLYNIEKYLIGCPFWDEALTEYATVDESGIVIWNSDDTMEEFYEKFFPDDIPDEWSKKDQMKSHGDGVLGPDQKVTIWKYSRNFLNKMPHLAWNTTKETNRYLESIKISNCQLEMIVKSSDRVMSEEILRLLKPRRKIKKVN